MFDFVLHTGLEHPSLAWIMVPTVLAFFLGFLIGKYNETVRTLRETVTSN